MIIVPLKGDEIKIVGSLDPLTVRGFANKKKNEDGKLSPFVYVEGTGKKIDVIPFSDIEEIKRVKVTLDKGTNVFYSVGPVRRRNQLPQPSDVVSVYYRDAEGAESIKDVSISKVKLAKGKGFSLRIQFSDKDGEWYELDDVEKINNGLKFDRNKFLSIYSEYRGSNES